MNTIIANVIYCNSKVAIIIIIIIIHTISIFSIFRSSSFKRARVSMLELAISPWSVNEWCNVASYHFKEIMINNYFIYLQLNQQKLNNILTCDSWGTTLPPLELSWKSCLCSWGMCGAHFPVYHNDQTQSSLFQYTQYYRKLL